jgi:hypothetical protein
MENMLNEDGDGTKARDSPTAATNVVVALVRLD